MYVGVIYYQPDLQAYGGRPYTYATDLPLKVGDRVIAPTQKVNEQKAVVVAIGLSKPSFDCKMITKYAEEE